eukprot:gene5868-11855_t
MLSTWNCTPITTNFCPRQFEYHPVNHGELIFGTRSGEVVLVNKDNEYQHLGRFGRTEFDNILGICWLRKETNKFVIGSADGRLCCGDRRYPDSGVSFMDASKSAAIKEYSSFKKMTSVHVNCNDDFILSSGHCLNVRIYDIETGRSLVDYKNAHGDHINISRFSNTSPYLFATSSFDQSAKLWDMRTPRSKPIYTVNCEKRLLMVCFSPNDHFFLTSSDDNEVSQYFVMDGRHHITFQTPMNGLDSNYTRSYYNASGSLVFSGGAEESHVNVFNAFTGELTSRCEMYPGRKHRSLYIQSLRGDPHRDDSLCVLANYRNIPNVDLVRVQLSSSFTSTDGNIEKVTYNGQYEHEDTDLITVEGKRSGGSSGGSSNNISSSTLTTDDGVTKSDGVPLSPLLLDNAGGGLLLPSCALPQDMLRLWRSGSEVDLLVYMYTGELDLHTVHSVLLLRQRQLDEGTKDVLAVAMSTIELTTSHPMENNNHDHDNCISNKLSASILMQCLSAISRVAAALEMEPLLSLIDGLFILFISPRYVLDVMNIAIANERLQLHELCVIELSGFLENFTLMHDESHISSFLSETMLTRIRSLRSDRTISIMSNDTKNSSASASVGARRNMNLPMDMKSHFALDTVATAAAAVEVSSDLCTGLDSLSPSPSSSVWTLVKSSPASPFPCDASKVPLSTSEHCTVPLQRLHTRHLLLLGDAVSAVSKQRELFVLDCGDMTWHKYTASGVAPKIFHQSTACSVFRDNQKQDNALSWSHWPCGGGRLGDDTGGRSPSLYDTTIQGDQSRFDTVVVEGMGMGMGRECVVHVIVYGGYCGRESWAPQHVTVLECRQRHYPTEHGKDPVWDFTWIESGLVRSSAVPPARTEHAAVTITFDNSTATPESFMVVFGGITTQLSSPSNDLWMLSVTELQAMRWYEVIQEESSPWPSPRDNHTLTVVRQHESSALLLLVGGADNRMYGVVSPTSDVWCLHVEYLGHTGSRSTPFRILWRQLVIDIPVTPLTLTEHPFARESHSCCVVKDCAFIFGGFVGQRGSNGSVEYLEKDAVVIVLSCSGDPSEWRLTPSMAPTHIRTYLPDKHTLTMQGKDVVSTALLQRADEIRSHSPSSPSSSSSRTSSIATTSTIVDNILHPNVKIILQQAVSVSQDFTSSSSSDESVGIVLSDDNNRPNELHTSNKTRCSQRFQFFVDAGLLRARCDPLRFLLSEAKWVGDNDNDNDEGSSHHRYREIRLCLDWASESEGAVMARSFRTVLTYLYGDIFLCGVEDLVQVLKLADMLGLPRLVTECEAALVRLVDTDNAVAEQDSIVVSGGLPSLRRVCLAEILKRKYSSSSSQNCDKSEVLDRELQALRLKGVDHSYVMEHTDASLIDEDHWFRRWLSSKSLNEE